MPDVQIVHPHTHQFLLFRTPLFTGLGLQFVPAIRTIRHHPQSDQVDNAGSVRVRINGLSKVLHVLHQINGPVGQFFRNLSMREHPHELEDEFVFAWARENRLVPSTSDQQTLGRLTLHVCFFFRRAVKRIVELILPILNWWVSLAPLASPGIGCGYQAGGDHSGRGTPSTHLTVENEISIGFQPTPHTVQELGEHPR